MASASSAAGSKASLPELTLRGIIIGGLITLIFTAANVYLGLKVGLTFATSIPAAVISMAVLRRFKGHNIKENNIVQTIASAAGTLSAIIFVLPGLVMVGYWQGFGFLQTAGVCIIGGVLGVMYSIPLRRALVTSSDLPYPEGVAAAEVLKVGDESASGTSHEENAKGLRVIVAGGITSAVMALLTAMKAAASEVTAYFKLGAGATTLGTSLSTALIGVGHLVGLPVGIAMLVGVVISYFILLPIFTTGDITGATALADVVDTTFSDDIRFIGVGTMAIAAIWTLLKIAAPIAVGIRQSLASSRARSPAPPWTSPSAIFPSLCRHHHRGVHGAYRAAVVGLRARYRYSRPHGRAHYRLSPLYSAGRPDYRLRVRLHGRPDWRV